MRMPPRYDSSFRCLRGTSSNSCSNSGPKRRSSQMRSTSSLSGNSGHRYHWAQFSMIWTIAVEIAIAARGEEEGKAPHRWSLKVLQRVLNALAKFCRVHDLKPSNVGPSSKHDMFQRVQSTAMLFPHGYASSCVMRASPIRPPTHTRPSGAISSELCGMKGTALTAFATLEPEGIQHMLTASLAWQRASNVSSETRATGSDK